MTHKPFDSFFDSPSLEKRIYLSTVEKLKIKEVETVIPEVQNLKQELDCEELWMKPQDGEEVNPRYHNIRTIRFHLRKLLLRLGQHYLELKRLKNSEKLAKQVLTKEKLILLKKELLYKKREPQRHQRELKILKELLMQEDPALAYRLISTAQAKSGGDFSPK